MTGYGPGAVVAWTAFTCASLIIAAITLHAVWTRGERRLLERIEAQQRERADRIAAAAFAASELAARRRHPTAPRPIPADQFRRMMADAEAIRDLYNDMDEWGRT
jgi:heme exporter protein D